MRKRSTEQTEICFQRKRSVRVQIDLPDRVELRV